MMVTKLLAESKRLRIAMASQEGVTVFGKFNRVNALIRGGLSAMRVNPFSGEITGGGNRYPKGLASSGRAFAGR
jgi:hypothetical protein